MTANAHLTAGGVLDRDGSPLFVVASLGRRVVALDEDGVVRWQAGTEGPVYALIVLDGESVAIGDDAGYVSAYRADGRLLWAYDLGSRVTALHGGWQGGLLAGGWDERLTFLDTDSGGVRVRWQADLGGPASGIASLAGIALATTLEGMIWGFDPSGATLWHRDLGATICDVRATQGAETSPVLVATQDGRLTALGSDGHLAWQRTIGQSPAGCPVFARSDLLGPSDAAIVAGTGGAAPVLALLTDRGDTLWRQAVPSSVGAVATWDLDGDGAEEILAGLTNGEIKAFDAQGRERSTVHAGLAAWHFVTAGNAGPMVLADVVAWRLVAAEGPAGGPWLRPPPMVEVTPQPLPTSAGESGAPAPEAGVDGEATLVFLGDVAPGRSMEMQLARFGAKYPWGGIAQVLAGADLAVVNLESALATRGKPRDKSYLIRAHPRWGQTLAAAGIDLVSLANNHALDYGTAGLEETLDTLQALGIATVGAGASSEEAHRPALLTVNGIRVAVLAYAASRWNGSADVPRTDRLAWAYPGDVQAGVRAVRPEADFVVVLLHAGTEYATEPSPDQVEVAHAAIEAGADLVVGHHPHVPQTFERLGPGLIVYSLGDALFDIPWQATMRGHLLRVVITADGLSGAELWPFWIDEAIRPRFLLDDQGQPRTKNLLP